MCAAAMLMACKTDLGPHPALNMEENVTKRDLPPKFCMVVCRTAAGGRAMPSKASCEEGMYQNIKNLMAPAPGSPAYDVVA